MLIAASRTLCEPNDIGYCCDFLKNSQNAGFCTIPIGLYGYVQVCRNAAGKNGSSNLVFFSMYSDMMWLEEDVSSCRAQLEGVKN